MHILFPLCFSPSGSTLASGEQTTSKKAHRSPLPPGPAEWLFNVSFSLHSILLLFLCIPSHTVVVFHVCSPSTTDELLTNHKAEYQGALVVRYNRAFTLQTLYLKHTNSAEP